MTQPRHNAANTLSTGPLSGLLVADFGRVLAGPYCTMLMADLGATVIKVESPLGDETRSWVPPARDGESTYFLSINRNKQSVVLDFTDPGFHAVDVWSDTANFELFAAEIGHRTF